MRIPETLTREQLATLTGRSRRYVDELIHSGAIRPLPRTAPSSRYAFPLREVAKATGIPREDLVSWLRENYADTVTKKGAA